MMNDWLNETLAFLHGSDLPVATPDLCPVRFAPDGTETVSMSCVSSLCQPRLGRQPWVSHALLFLAVDAQVDQQLPQQIGESFKSRLEALPVGSDGERMFRGLYRVMVLIRNGLSHARGQCVFGPEVLEIQFVFRNTRNCLRLPVAALGVFHYLALYSAEHGPALSAWDTALLRTFYDDLAAAVEIEDVFGVGLEPLGPGLRLKRVRRYRPDATAITECEGRLAVTRYRVPALEAGFSGVDYGFSHQDQDYLVPDEALDAEGGVPLTELERWRITG